MNTFLKYVIGLDLLNCHAKFRGHTINRSRENEFEVAIFGSFLDTVKREYLAHNLF